MNLTKNFRFRKPEGTDPINIEDLNDNFDLLDEELEKRPTGTDDISATIVTFEKASERANIAPKETLAILFGKIMKTFSDLKKVAFSGSYKDLEEKPVLGSGAGASVIESVDDLAAVTEEGYVVGGKAGAQIINNLDGCSLERREDGVYITYTPPGGADPVSKKLGKPDADYQLVLQPTPSHIHIPTLGCNVRVYTDDSAGQWYGDIQITGVQSIWETSGHAFLSNRIRGSFNVTVECKSYKYLYIDNTHTWGGTFFVQYL